MFKRVVIAVFTLALAGCASIVGKSKHPVTLNSNPSGAQVTVTDENGQSMFQGTTPATVKLRAGESYFHAKRYRIEFSKEGYAPQSTDITGEISGWYFGNILFGGLIGAFIVDPMTGKMWKLQPSYTANLAQKVAPNTSADVQTVAPAVHD